MKTKQKIGKSFINSKARPDGRGGLMNLAKISSKKNPLLSAMVKEDNKTLTENGAQTFKSSLNALVDLFGMGAALRNRPDNEVIELFIKAFAEDRLLAMKLLFNIRNIRGGAGERKVFRTILKWLFKNHSEVILKNIGNIPYFGRFDDLYEAFDSSPLAEKNVLAFVQTQIEEDIKNYENDKPISLLPKWLPSENTSSLQTRALGRKIREYLGWTPKQYRKTLSVLREYLNVIEQKMSAGDWPSIDFEKVPSKASLLYRKAFGKHEPERYTAFIEAVKKGEKKINASALFPYEIIEKILYGGADEQTMDVLWDALPDYIEDKGRNILAVADCSGSMNGRPKAVSISLALLTAERNQGPFAGHFITYSERPRLQKIVGNGIREKMRCVEKCNAMNTNLQAVFQMILKTALENHIQQKDMPAQIILITDCEFDNPQNGGTNLEAIRIQYKEAGYEMAQLVFWNANSKQNNVAAQANEKGVLLVSGASPSVFKTLLSGKQYTPQDQMLETLSQAIYDRVVI